MQRPSLLVLVVLVAFAGCNGFLGGNDPTPRVTPADVPTDSPTRTPSSTLKNTQQQSGQCISSLPDLGVANASALAAAHNRTLHNRSFTVSWSHTEVYRDGSQAYSHTEIRVGEKHSRRHIILESLGPSTRYERVEIWTDGERVVKRSTSGHNANYNTRVVTGRGRFPVFAPYYVSFPEAVLDNATTCVIDQFTHDETTLFVVAFIRMVPKPIFYPNATVVRNVTGRVLVDASGIVHEIRWDYTVRTTDGAMVDITASTYYTEIGTTTVERPVWYEKAVNQTQTTRTTAGA